MIYDPLVSVVVQNYNYGRYLKEAINSILEQDYANKEVIVVDDGSTDDSRDILNEYVSDGIKLIFQENMGQSAAMNAGVYESNGDYIAFLDSDDVWAENKLSMVMEAFAGSDNLSLVQHTLAMIDEDSKHTQATHPRGLLFGVRDILAEYISSNYTGYFSATSGLVVPREIIEIIFPLNTNWRICADVLLTRPLPFFGNILTLDEPLGCYRVHGDNNWMSTSGQSMWRENQRKYTEYTNQWFESEGYSERLDFDRSEQAAVLLPLYHPRRLLCELRRIMR